MWCMRSTALFSLKAEVVAPLTQAYLIAVKRSVHFPFQTAIYLWPPDQQARLPGLVFRPRRTRPGVYSSTHAR